MKLWNRLFFVSGLAGLAGCAGYKPGRPGGFRKAEDFPVAPDVVLDAYSRLPKPVRMRNPEYPPELRKQKISGTVVVDIFVDKEGQVAGADCQFSPSPFRACGPVGSEGLAL